MNGCRGPARRRSAVMLGPALLLVATLGILGTITTASTRPPVRYEAFFDQALSRPAWREPAPLRSGLRPPPVGPPAQPPARPAARSPLRPAAQPPSVDSNAVPNRRGPVALPLINTENVKRPPIAPKFSSFLKLLKKILPLKPRQKTDKSDQASNSLTEAVPLPDVVETPKDEDPNSNEIIPDYSYTKPHRPRPPPARLPRPQVPFYPPPVPVSPLPTQDLLSWLQSLLPGALAEELFLEPCRISRSDPPPNEPLQMLEEVTDIAWRFPRTAQELSVRLATLLYRTPAEKWELVKLLALDALDHSLWESVTDEEVDEVGRLLSQTIVRQLNRAAGSLRRYVPTLPLLDAHHLMPQPRVTRRFDAEFGCQMPSAETSLVKLLGAKVLSMALHALADSGNISESVLRYQRRSIDERLCQLTILGFGLDGALGACREGGELLRFPWQERAHRARRDIRGYYDSRAQQWEVGTGRSFLWELGTMAKLFFFPLVPLLFVVALWNLFPMYGLWNAESAHQTADPVDKLTGTVLPAIEKQEQVFGETTTPHPTPTTTAKPQFTNYAELIIPRFGEKRPDSNGETKKTEDTEHTKQAEEEPDKTPPQSQSEELLGPNEPRRPGDEQTPQTAAAGEEEADDILALVRQVLASSDAEQHRAGPQPFFPLRLRVQRHTLRP
ncbi:uncharacterized protein LOC122378580 isoform X2 [Amphibalanus amphitrite]|nr:uncharacterized protein LOC122378580 isoform X2 [Amphibalanus amphitrite]